MWCCGGVYTDGELHVGVDDDSFTRFNVTMVQQYFREEAVHQQHKVHWWLQVTRLLTDVL